MWVCWKVFELCVIKRTYFGLLSQRKDKDDVSCWVCLWQNSNSLTLLISPQENLCMKFFDQVRLYVLRIENKTRFCENFFILNFFHFYSIFFLYCLLSDSIMMSMNQIRAFAMSGLNDIFFSWSHPRLKFKKSNSRVTTLLENLESRGNCSDWIA